MNWWKTKGIRPTLTPTLFERLRFRGGPVANERSIVTSGHARFTFLTPRLVRLEWSETGEFEDRSTYAFPTRHAPAPNFITRYSGDTLIVTTDALELRYSGEGAAFTPDNLAIAFDLDGESITWTPGTPNPLNLRGTRRTLDECAGDAALTEGLFSRAGWSLFDDSRNVVYAEGWVAPRPDHAVQDWYFFAFGHDYMGGLAEYTQFGGEIPLIPRYVLGAWWSRYWPYSAQDFKDLVGEFKAHGFPLDVLVIDMDWHTPDGWTGYTWNKKLFPNPPKFLKWVHNQGLRTTLNLHPADGIQPHEEIYPKFAEAMGVDPATKEPVPFRITDKKFVKHYFELLHHPMEDDGVDFWWMDWQQGEISEVKGLDPLGWINHLHFEDSKRRGQRAMLYSRWGGLGGHRYHIGFSGDTWATWDALQFQPYMTAAASNVAYGWWSHDIGGHLGGVTEPELYARWVQYGTVSPCLRLHSSKNAHTERRPWAFGAEIEQITQAAYEWRYAMVPYIYTMARVAVDTSVSLCRPMYYAHPAAEDAYITRFQYYFGDQLIAAPLVHPVNPATGLTTQDVWIPAGTWIDMQTLEAFTGPCWVRLVGDLTRLPVLAKAGAIIPEYFPASTTDAQPKDHLIITAYTGKSGQFRLYEDDGISEDYHTGQAEWTPITTQIVGRAWTVTIAPVEGHCAALPDRRGYEVRLIGSRRPGSVMINKKPVDSWTYDAATLTTTISVPKRGKTKATTITAVAAGNTINALDAAHNRTVLQADLARLLGDVAPADSADMAALLRLAAPGKLDAVARAGGPFARIYEYTTPEEAAMQLGSVIIAAPLTGAAEYDLSITFTLHKGAQTTQDTVNLPGVSGTQIVDTPFAWDRTVTPAQWSAEVSITWEGTTLTYTHTSAPLFPSITTWHHCAFDAAEVVPALERVVDPAGRPQAAYEWATATQDPAALHANVNEGFDVPLWHHYLERTRAGEYLVAYVATTITSPVERAAVLSGFTYHQAEIHLNGEKLPDSPDLGTTATNPPPFFRPPNVKLPVTLRAGDNTLVVVIRRGEPWPFLGVGLQLTTPDGASLSELTYR